MARMFSQMTSDMYKPCKDGKVLLYWGLVFDIFEHYRRVLLDYFVQEGLSNVSPHSDLRRVTSMCEFRWCP